MSDNSDNPPEGFYESQAKAERAWSGSVMTDDQRVESFPLLDRKQRYSALREMDAAIENASTGNLKQFSDLNHLRRRLGHLNSDMLKADR